MKIKTNYVPDDVDYITAGKVYECTKILPKRIKDDHGNTAFVWLSKCAHLDGKNWEIVE
jgi:hypothetical protein